MPEKYNPEPKQILYVGFHTTILWQVNIGLAPASSYRCSRVDATAKTVIVMVSILPKRIV